ncbi:MAG: hypothetical protein WCG82_08180 [Bacteroidota bacterium]
MDKRFEFFKEQYYFELNRKNELTNSLAIPIGFLTVLFTGYSYLFFNLKFLNMCYLAIIFTILIFISIVFAIRAIYHLYFTLKGLNYGYVPEPINLFKYEQDYIKYADNHGITADKIDEIFFENLKKSLVTTTNKNRENNNFRANRILKANINTIYAIFFLFLSAIPFIININI